MQSMKDLFQKSNTKIVIKGKAPRPKNQNF